MTKKDWLRVLIIGIGFGPNLYVLKYLGWLGFALFVLIYFILLRYLSKNQ